VRLNGQPYDVHTDHLDTPQLLTDRHQRIVWRQNQTAFGAMKVQSRLTFNLRFPGQYYDQESGLHYNYFRDYDPGLGRYIQRDPIGLEGGINTYAYVDGNPLSYVDPLGLFTSACWGPGCWFTHPDSRPPEGVGSFSYFRGLYRAAEFEARRSGLMGECEQVRAEVEDLVLRELLASPEVQKYLPEAIQNYIADNPRRFAGRAGTGALVTYILGRAGKKGSAAGTALGGTAVYGDVRELVKNNRATAESVAAAIAGGYVDN